MGVPRSELPDWNDLQLLVAQMARKPLLEDVPVDIRPIYSQADEITGEGGQHGDQDARCDHHHRGGEAHAEAIAGGAGDCQQGT